MATHYVELEDLQKLLNDFVNQTFQNFVEETAHAAVEDTPVDTGFLQSNHHIGKTMRKPLDSRRSELRKRNGFSGDKNKVKKRLSERAKKLKPSKKTTYIYNTTPYAETVETGIGNGNYPAARPFYRKQASQANVNNNLDKAIRRIRRKYFAGY